MVLEFISRVCGIPVNLTVQHCLCHYTLPEVIVIFGLSLFVDLLMFLFVVTIIILIYILYNSNYNITNIFSFPLLLSRLMSSHLACPFSFPFLLFGFGASVFFLHMLNSKA